MTDPAAVLAGCLPADPRDAAGIGVPAAAVRGVLAELVQLRRRDERPDGGE